MNGIAGLTKSKRIWPLRWLAIVALAAALGYSWTMLLSRDVMLLLPQHQQPAASPLSRVASTAEYRLSLYFLFLFLYALPWLVVARQLVAWAERPWHDHKQPESDSGSRSGLNRDRKNRRRAGAAARVVLLMCLLLLPFVLAVVNRRLFGLR